MRPVVHDEYRRLGGTHWWIRGRRSIFDRLLREVVPLPERARILDVGPGSGVNLPVLRDRGRVCALDLSAPQLRACRQAGAADLLRADATAPPLRSGSVDLLCALDVLEHLADDRAALAAWRDLLSPEGRLLLTVPALRVLWGRQDVLAGHHRRYGRRELARLLREAGFAIERLTYFNTVLFLPILGVRLLMRPFLSRTVATGGSDFGTPSLGLNGLLYRLFAAEAAWLARRDLPLGVSLLCVARRATT